MAERDREPVGVREPGDGAAGNGNPLAGAATLRTGPPRQARLGEELPIFCERCGYSLHGLPQVRCGACAVLHFSCPECDHHQPINTLRPAAQRIIGRLRALGLALVVFLKLNYFGWTLLAWGAAGTEISYRYDWNANRVVGGVYTYRLIEPDLQEEGIFALFCFGFGFAALGRMLLLRWRSGVLIGITLVVLVGAAWFAGAFLRTWDVAAQAESPLNDTVLTYVASAAAGVLIGASCAWGIWLALAHAFLPKRATTSLIAWQTALSAREPREVQTDRAVSVTV